MCPASSHPSPAGADSLAQPLAQPQPQPQQQWLDWAAAQIDATMALDAAAVGTIVMSIRALSATVPDAGAFHLAEMVKAVQAHDRLTQQLAHVTQALRSLGAMTAGGAGADWALMRERQLHAFSMSEERTLFQRMVPEQSGHAVPDMETNNPVSVELF